MRGGWRVLQVHKRQEDTMVGGRARGKLMERKVSILAGQRS